MASKSGYSIIVSSRAQKELAESWGWYEDRLPGLGDKFVNEVLKCTRQIEEKVQTGFLPNLRHIKKPR